MLWQKGFELIATITEFNGEACPKKNILGISIFYSNTVDHVYTISRKGISPKSLECEFESSRLEKYIDFKTV